MSKIYLPTKDELLSLVRAKQPSAAVRKIIGFDPALCACHMVNYTSACFWFDQPKDKKSACWINACLASIHIPVESHWGHMQRLARMFNHCGHRMSKRRQDNWLKLLGVEMAAATLLHSDI